MQLIDGEFRIFVLEGLLTCKGSTDHTGLFTPDVVLPGEEEEEDIRSKSPANAKRKASAKSKTVKGIEEPPEPVRGVCAGAMQVR